MNSALFLADASGLGVDLASAVGATILALEEDGGFVTVVIVDSYNYFCFLIREIDVYPSKVYKKTASWCLTLVLLAVSCDTGEITVKSVRTFPGLDIGTVDKRKEED